MREIVLEAPAKINLYLAVLARRADGYHEIESLMQKLELSDRLHLRRGGRDIRLACPGAELPENKDNLAFRAARLFLEHINEGGNKAGNCGVEILLEKKVPVAAGLGGGSSDAAAVLRGLDLLFDTRLGTEALLRMAGQLGADVPFFVVDWPAAWATGIGEKLTAATPLADCQILLVNPGLAVSTRWVYENFALTTRGNDYILARDPQAVPPNFSGPSVRMAERLHNELESVTMARFPELGRIKQQMRQDSAAGVLMSGSGPTVFGLFADEDRARHSFNKFRRQYGDGVFLTRPCRSCSKAVSWGVVKR